MKQLFRSHSQTYCPCRLRQRTHEYVLLYLPPAYSNRPIEFDTAEYLDTEKLQKGYLDYVANEGTEEELLKAIADVARARGMAKTAKEAGITREGLYKALSLKGNPSFSTVWKLLRSIGYTLTPTPIANAEQV